jgi:vacuolar-type H+-ATPase subunit I/STV1
LLFYSRVPGAVIVIDVSSLSRQIKEQLIAYLKTKPEDKQSVLKAVEDIEEIEKIISQTKDAVPLIVKIKETIFKSKRDLRKYIALQRDLEKLGYNDLFKSAAKLDALAS